MRSYSPYQRRINAVARVRALPSFHIIVSLYCFSMGVLALVLALNRI